MLKAETKGTERQFNLKTDVQTLQQVLRHYPNVKMIVVDPISAYIGDTNDYKDAEVRQMLAPLIKLATDTGIALIAIKHFNKDSEKTAMQRSSGSIAYVAVARAALVFVPDPENESQTLMLMVKSNLGLRADGLAFNITKRDAALAARIEWRGSTKISAEEALRGKPGPKGEKLESAKEFLTKLLIDSGIGAVPSKEIIRLAAAAGFKEKTIRRAKVELKLKAELDGHRRWVWSLPADTDEAGISPL